MNIGAELRELRRREAREADKRDALLARLRWRYGDEEGRRRFAGESAEAARDLDAWGRVNDHARYNSPLEVAAMEIVRGVQADLEDAG